MPISVSVLCLATALFFEARNQPIDGQIAVGEVILNRVASHRWPDDVCSVVSQPRQFSFTHDGLSDNPQDYIDNYPDAQAWLLSKQIAEDLDKGKGLLGITSTFYHSVSVNPYWASSLVLDGSIGDHVFYSLP